MLSPSQPDRSAACAKRMMARGSLSSPSGAMSIAKCMGLINAPYAGNSWADSGFTARMNRSVRHARVLDDVLIVWADMARACRQPPVTPVRFVV